MPATRSRRAADAWRVEEDGYLFSPGDIHGEDVRGRHDNSFVYYRKNHENRTGRVMWWLLQENKTIRKKKRDRDPHKLTRSPQLAARLKP